MYKIVTLLQRHVLVDALLYFSKIHIMLYNTCRHDTQTTS